MLGGVPESHAVSYGVTCPKKENWHFEAWRSKFSLYVESLLSDIV